MSFDTSDVGCAPYLVSIPTWALRRSLSRRWIAFPRAASGLFFFFKDPPPPEISPLPHPAPLPFSSKSGPQNFSQIFFPRTGTENKKANEVNPPAVEMPSGFHTAHVIDFCFAVRHYSQSLEQS